MPHDAAGFDLLIEKLCLEGVNGIKPLLPDARFSQDVAMVAFMLDALRQRVRYLEGRVGRLTEFQSGSGA
jgi:hypothetical protein